MRIKIKTFFAIIRAVLYLSPTKTLSLFLMVKHIYSCILSRVSDPDPVFLHGSGAGFQISLDPDPDLVSAQILEQKKLQKGL